MDRPALPGGWTWRTIEEVAAYVQRGKSPKYVATSALPVVNQKCVRWHGVEAEHLKFVDPEQWSAWADERTLRDGDILWNSTGTGTIGRAALYRPLAGFQRVVADSHVTVVRLREGLPEYVHQWIKSPTLQGRIDAMQNGSTNQVELARSEVLATAVPWAPVEEQRRIVAKLDALQSRSRRARQALDAVPPLLEKLRQSILAAAFRGDLTKDWRAKNKDVEPASELLKRIRIERRKKWEEAELAKMKAKGKPPKDDKWKAKYKEPEPVETEGLPELPEGWCWATAEQISSRITDGTHQPPPTTSSGIPFIGIRNIIGGTVDWSTVDKWVSAETHFALTAGCPPERNDILYTAVGATFGRAVLVGDWKPFLFQRHIAMVKPLRGIVSPAYLEAALNAPGVFAQAKLAARGAAQPTVTLGDLARLVLPIAPIREQAVVEARISGAQTWLRSLDSLAQDSNAELSRCDQAILASAFRGSLLSFTVSTSGKGSVEAGGRGT